MLRTWTFPFISHTSTDPCISHTQPPPPPNISGTPSSLFPRTSFLNLYHSAWVSLSVNQVGIGYCLLFVVPDLSVGLSFEQIVWISFDA